MAIQCHIQLFPGWRAATSKAGQSIEYDRQALDKAVRHNWPEAQLLREAVQSKLEGAASVTVEYINATLLTCCKDIFPARRVAAQSRPWQHESVQTKVADLWVCRSHLRDTQASLSSMVAQCQRPRLPVQLDSISEIAACVFRFWKASSRLQAVYKELRKRGRQRRRQFLEDQLSRAKAASERHDTKELYAVVRQLAPKTHYRKVRIRQVDGSPLCAEAEYLEIHRYFSELFSAGLWQDFHADQPPAAGGYLITPAEVRAALKANKVGKSVPVAHAPSGAWIACSNMLVITEVLAGHFSACINGECRIPKLWTDCHLALIPKPNKSLSRPECLRPLGIQDVAGKSFARVLKNKLLDEVGQALHRFPQFAYIAGRNTEGAIARVTEHCCNIRDDLGQCKRNIYSKRAKHAISPATGGAQLSVDMSTAFDRVPRLALRKALVWIGASREMVDVIEKLHDQCDYHIRHSGFSGTVGMRRGVRQGCTLAPVLFAIFSCYLADQIGIKTNYRWMQEHLTLYADDTHASWAIRSADDLHFLENCVLAIHDVFQFHGMMVNPPKSSIIMAMHGKLCRQWQRSKVHKTAKGSFLYVGAAQLQLRIPIHDSMVYLGIVASYGQFETQTMQHRLQVARGSRMRLVRILHSNRHLSIKQRVEMYIACVRSSSIYGIAAVGVTPACLNRLRSFEQKHIRAIARSPVHLTKESTHSLYARLHIQEPDEALLRILRGQCSKQRRQGDEPDAWRLSSVRALEDYIRAKQHGLQATSVDKTSPCPTCGLYFVNRTAMRQHHAKIHKVSLVPTGKDCCVARNRVVIHEHTVDGMPICKKCGRRFDSFTALKSHALDQCEGTSAELLGSNDRTQQAVSSGLAWQHAAESAVDTTPVMLRQDVLALLGGQNWQQVLSLPLVFQQLKNYCGICGQWLVSTPTALRNHVKHIHSDAWLLCPDAAFKCSTLAIARGQPCGACGARTSSKTVHRCSIMFHLCLLDSLVRARKLGPSTLISRHGFQRSRDGPFTHRRGQHVLSTYFRKSSGPGGKEGPPGGEHGSQLRGTAGGEAQQMGKRQCQRGFGTRKGQKPEQAAANPQIGGSEQLAAMGRQQPGRLEPRRRPDQRGSALTGTHGLTPRGRAQPDPHREGIHPDHGGAWRRGPSNYVPGGTSLEGVSGEGRSLLEPSANNAAQEWLDRMARITEDQALAGAIKLGICQMEPGQELEWLYLKWDAESKKLIRDAQRDPVKHAVFMGWLKELQLGMASSQSLLRFHSTRPLAESYQGETVTFLLALGYRDPFMDRAHYLLTLMSGLGATKVAAFRIRPARMERQVLARILEERFPPPNRGYPRRQQRQTGQDASGKKADQDME